MQGGKGMAVDGIVLGAIGTALFLIYIVFVSCSWPPDPVTDRMLGAVPRALTGSWVAPASVEKHWTLAGAGAVGMVAPHGQAFYQCPLCQATGIYCPVCGARPRPCTPWRPATSAPPPATNCCCSSPCRSWPCCGGGGCPAALGRPAMVRFRVPRWP